MSASDDAPTGRAGGVRRVTRDSAILASGSVANGLLAYVFFALATQSLGADRAAPVAVLWSYWALAAAVLTLAVQHWVIRTLAHDGHGATVAASLPRIVVGGGVLSVVAGLVAFAFRQTLFDLDGLAFPAMVAAVTAGSLFTGLVRGALAGRERYRPTAASLAGENLVRVLAAIPVAVFGGGAEAFGVALLIGPLVGLVWLRSLRFETPAQVSAIRNPLALLSGIAGGMLLAQIVLTGAPVVLAVAGGASAEVTSLFVALAVWRAPYLVAVGIAPQLTTALTRSVVQGRSRRLARLRSLIVAATAAGAALAALIGATLLQPVLRAIFGSDVELSDRQLVELGAGTAVALGNLALLLMLLALGRSRAATGAWLAALAVSGGWILASGMAPLERVVLAFLIAQLTAFAMSYAMARPSATPTTSGEA
jgi:O-antigen/teichoic acid export membrane protein